MDKQILNIFQDLKKISTKCKDKTRMKILGIHAECFHMIKYKKYSQVLTNLQSHEKIFLFDSLTILSYNLLKALILKYLKRQIISILRQKQSQQYIFKTLLGFDQNKLKVNTSYLYQKSLQLFIMSITIIAQHFRNFKHTQNALNLYKQAYNIALKHLTQYHKLTQTLYEIYTKYKLEDIRKKINENNKINNIDILNQSTKSINIQSHISSKNKYSLQINNNSKKSHKLQDINQKQRYDKRIKTVQDSLNKFNNIHNKISSKSKIYQLIYGRLSIMNVNNHTQHKNNNNGKLSLRHKNQILSDKKASIKQNKVRRRLLTTNTQNNKLHDQPQQMKQLQKISKLYYLPKIQNKCLTSHIYINLKESQNNYEKMKSIQVIKGFDTIEKLKPKYFQTKDGSYEGKGMKSLKENIIENKEQINADKTIKEINNQNNQRNNYDNKIIKDKQQQKPSQCQLI